LRHPPALLSHPAIALSGSPALWFGCVAPTASLAPMVMTRFTRTTAPAALADRLMDSMGPVVHSLGWQNDALARELYHAAERVAGYAAAAAVAPEPETLRCYRARVRCAAARLDAHLATLEGMDVHRAAVTVTRQVLACLGIAVGGVGAVRGVALPPVGGATPRCPTPQSVLAVPPPAHPSRPGSSGPPS